MPGKLKLIYSTIRFLKPVQVKYQILYRLVKPKKLNACKTNRLLSLHPLRFTLSPPVFKSYLGHNSFSFLNLEHHFEKEIDWHFLKFGKLWNYNLQYGNYLLQQDIPLEEKLDLIRSLYRALNEGQIPLEPYPASLQIINIIRLLSGEGLREKDISENAYGELNFLSRRPEYHLLGNHLLENGFALMMGGAFFGEPRWLDQGEKILRKQLDEQILSDGAHFELSPMYQQILLFRVLELFDWYKNDSNKKNDFLEFVVEKAGSMCSWIRNMTFKNGKIPLFNDSAEGIAFSTKWLLDYARALEIPVYELPLDKSGYRSADKGNYECRIDFAQIGASYQPGHAHADTLSFLLNYKGKPLFVEAGTSTYDSGLRRMLERSTESHNTVVAGGQNQSGVWAAFRVGNRAKTKILIDSENEMAAEHDGYLKRFGIKHQRRFTFDDNMILIEDKVAGNPKLRLEFHLHIAPGFSADISGDTLHVGKEVSVRFKNYREIQKRDFTLADGFNKYSDSKKIVVSFFESLQTQINFKNNL